MFDGQTREHVFYQTIAAVWEHYPEYKGHMYIYLVSLDRDQRTKHILWPVVKPEAA